MASPPVNPPDKRPYQLDEPLFLELSRNELRKPDDGDPDLRPPRDDERPIYLVHPAPELWFPYSCLYYDGLHKKFSRCILLSWKSFVLRSSLIPT